MTRDTVIGETLAWRATSWIVTALPFLRPLFSLTRGRPPFSLSPDSVNRTPGYWRTVRVSDNNSFNAVRKSTP